LKQIVVNHDYLQPDEQQAFDALEQSRDYWYRLASLACALGHHGLPPEYTNLCYILDRLPKFRGRPKETRTRPYGVSPHLALCLQATSTGKLVANSGCDRLQKERSNPPLLQIGISFAIPYNFERGVLNLWIGTKEEKAAGPNFLGIIPIGWCHILSARLVKIYGEGAFMQYTKSEPECNNENQLQPSETHVIDVGEVDEEVVRWWSAILNNGWEGIVG
jgi:hypothetical protein